MPSSQKIEAGLSFDPAQVRENGSRRIEELIRFFSVYDTQLIFEPLRALCLNKHLELLEKIANGEVIANSRFRDTGQQIIAIECCHGLQIEPNPELFRFPIFRRRL